MPVLRRRGGLAHRLLAAKGRKLRRCGAKVMRLRARGYAPAGAGFVASSLLLLNLRLRSIAPRNVSPIPVSPKGKATSRMMFGGLQEKSCKNLALTNNTIRVNIIKTSRVRFLIFKPFSFYPYAPKVWQT